MRELDDARYKAIGARIRDVRLQRNMSQAELAEKAFISVPHMSEVENGKTKLRLSTFVYITEALQVSADVLLRTNTPEVNGIYQGEFNDLLADCSPAEIDSINEETAGDYNHVPLSCNAAASGRNLLYLRRYFHPCFLLSRRYAGHDFFPEGWVSLPDDDSERRLLHD